MTRFLVPLAVPLLLVAAACGGGVNATNSPKASPSPGRGFQRGAFGQLVKITGTTLILSGVSGDTTVDYDSSTRIQRTSTAAVGDIVPGVCLQATGQKDAGGVVTAAVVRLTSPVNGSCAPSNVAGVAGGGGGLFGGGARPTPRPGTPSPPANLGFVAGEVTAVSGMQITIKGLSGTDATVTVPTTVRVSRTESATAADLQVGECITAAGQRDSSGTVQARSLTISPPSTSGSCSRGGGAFFGGGGGGFFGGGGSN
jgi:uncharacterized protein DUF5666